MEPTQQDLASMPLPSNPGRSPKQEEALRYLLSESKEYAFLSSGPDGYDYFQGGPDWLSTYSPNWDPAIDEERGPDVVFSTLDVGYQLAPDHVRHFYRIGGPGWGVLVAHGPTFPYPEQTTPEAWADWRAATMRLPGADLAEVAWDAGFRACSLCSTSYIVPPGSGPACPNCGAGLRTVRCPVAGPATVPM